MTIYHSRMKTTNCSKAIMFQRYLKPAARKIFTIMLIEENESNDDVSWLSSASISYFSSRVS